VPIRIVREIGWEIVRVDGPLDLFFTHDIPSQGRAPAAQDHPRLRPQLLNGPLLFRRQRLRDESHGQRTARKAKGTDLAAKFEPRLDWLVVCVFAFSLFPRHATFVSAH
jgi:hypothetical protein